MLKSTMGKIKLYIQELYLKNKEMLWYYLMWILYGILIIITTLYCYLRLDFIRTTPKPPTKITFEIKNDKAGLPHS